MGRFLPACGNYGGGLVMSDLEVDFDYLLVGGGLQSGLMAAAIAHHQPSAKVGMLERQPTLAGNHTWSFHESDLPTSCRDWFAPFIETRWADYEVIVGGTQKKIDLCYLSMSSNHFAGQLESLADRGQVTIIGEADATEVTTTFARLRDGRCFRANAVFDNRGPDSSIRADFAGGFQKFWGFEIELESDWPRDHPILMDDRLDQSDGFRFMYSLPFEPRRVLVEDTRFSNCPSLDRTECQQTVQAYLASMGFDRYKVLREEHGVLPMPTRGQFPGAGLPAFAGGYRGGWFHAATGYSFPLAIQFAEVVATTPVDVLADRLRSLSDQHSVRAAFARFLNRLLFDLVKPAKRYQIFRRFYRVLNEDRVARFYGHRFTAFDAFRIVVGVPPGGLQPFRFFRSLIAKRPERALEQSFGKSEGVLT
jgi:lycopene beta-cyclase